MRVCPKCGYVDPPYWRHSKWSSWIDIIEFENFKEIEPELASKLWNGEKLVEDEHYFYRITKSKAKVHRKAKVDFMGDWVQSQEKVAAHGALDFRSYWNLAKLRQDKNQRRLDEVIKP